MIFYTSDLHLGHKNIIESCKRPFSSVEEMDETLIGNWNERVHRDDCVYVLGDLIFRAQLPSERYLERLRGRKFLILGKHDQSWIKKTELGKYFESVERLAVINTGRGKATLCHFPMLDHEGKYLIHGHIHGNTDQPYWSFLKSSAFSLFKFLLVFSLNE